MVPFFDDRVAAWVAARIPGCARGFGECRAMGVASRDRMAAGVVFHNWQPEAGVVEMSCAADDPRWMTRRVMRVAFGYVFDGLQCQMAVARIHEDNDGARKLWRGLGADEFVIPRLRGKDAAEAIYTITAEQWAASPFNKTR